MDGVNGAAVQGTDEDVLDKNYHRAKVTVVGSNHVFRLSGAEKGMSYCLPRVVGLTVAADWLLTGTVSADEALQRGLVSELVDDEGCSIGRSSWRPLSRCTRRSPLR